MSATGSSVLKMITANMPSRIPLFRGKERVERSVRLSAFLLILLSAYALLLTQKLQGSSLLLMSVTIFAWFFARKPVRGSFWEIVSFLYLIFFFFDLFRLSSSLAPALVHLFVFIIINKVFNLFTDRDYYQLYLLTFLCMLAASSLSVEVEMFYVIILYIPLFVWNIVSITLFREWKRAEYSDPFPFSLFSIRFGLGIVAASLSAFVAAMGIFFVLPRMQLGFLGNLRAGKVQHVSGFSQTVSLGDMAKVDQDSSAVMRIRVTSKDPLEDQHFYWRGIAFDHYDGKTWTSANSGTRFLYQDSSNYFYNSNSWERTDSLVKQEFYLTPMDARVIFGLDRIVRINGAFVAISRDNNGTLTGMSYPENYEVYSRFVPVSQKRLSTTGARIPEYIKRDYLQLPSRSPQIEQLVHRIVRNAISTTDRVQAVQDYLEKNYQYTTEDLPGNADDPLSAFLFEKRAGHCEYFATAMAILLRYIGVPTRLVNGFLEGEFNEVGGFYLVRQNDAHSWVEVYVDGSWAPFDPSPRIRLGGATIWYHWMQVRIRKVIESINFFWDRYILIFSAQDQLDALSTAREKYQEMSSNTKQKSKEIPLELAVMWKQKLRKQVVLITLAVILALGVIYAVRSYLRHRRLHQILSTPVLFYHEMLSILERKGFRKAPQATPAEFVRDVSQEIPSAYSTDLAFITDLFYRSRFGNYPVSPSEQTVVRFSLHRLQQMS